jgi:hypothetical protein
VNNSNRKNKHLIFIILIVVIIFCGLPLAYIVAPELEESICYGRIAKELKVAPTYEAIGSALLTRIKEDLHIGMDQDQVIAYLEQIAPIDNRVEGTGWDGGHVEFTGLKMCLFSDNDIVLLIYYSPANRLEEVEIYR